MNSAHRRLHILLALAAATAAQWAVAADGSPASPTPVPTTSATGTAPAEAQTKPESHDSAAPPVCFKLTLHCVGGTASAKSAAQTTAPPKGPAGTAKGVSEPAPNKPLNLAAPDVRTVVPADELNEPLPTEDQEADVQETETVQVKAAPEAPEVPSGLASIWWAVVHPTQAWRIFSPAQ
jgi:hypothetical protein